MSQSWAEYLKLRYALAMSHLRSLCVIRLLACTAILLGLVACERETYSTWSCNTPTEAKIPMILRKAQMEFKGSKLDFCGSLGNLSYFDQKCTVQTEQSNTVFTPSSGLMVSGGQEYQCTVL